MAGKGEEWCHGMSACERMSGRRVSTPDLLCLSLSSLLFSLSFPSFLSSLIYFKFHFLAALAGIDAPIFCINISVQFFLNIPERVLSPDYALKYHRFSRRCLYLTESDQILMEKEWSIKQQQRKSGKAFAYFNPAASLIRFSFGTHEESEKVREIDEIRPEWSGLELSESQMGVDREEEPVDEKREENLIVSSLNLYTSELFSGSMALPKYAHPKLLIQIER